MVMYGDDPNARLAELHQRVDRLENFIKQHIGYQPGAHNPNTPHPQLSAISLGAYTITNGTTDRSYDANTVAVAELADIVYTMWTDLHAIGILG